MGFEQLQVVHSASHTVLDTWVNTTVRSVASAEDRLKIKNLSMRGIFWVSQSSEVNTQFGAIVLALYRISEQVGTPDMDVDGSGIDKLMKIQYVYAAGQNNPVLFSLFYKAVNLAPGIKLMLSTQAKAESSTAIVHHVQMIGSLWETND